MSAAAPVCESCETPLYVHANSYQDGMLQTLLQADGAAGQLLAQQPERFAKQFAAYDAAVPLHAIFPSDEARAFRQWVAQARARGEIE